MGCRFPGWMVFGFAFGIGVVSACQVVLGDYEVWGEGRDCETDTDCEGDKGCDSGYQGTCRKRCTNNSFCDSAQFIECPWSELCPDPIGAPCDGSLDSYDSTCGEGAHCLAKSSDNEEVKGYCTVSCREEGGGTPCPPGYACDTDDYCLCVDDQCEEQFEDYLD